MKQEVKWSEEFSIGVEPIDDAHKQLFSIVRRIILLTKDEEKTQWACIEGIKYFKSYALRHFQQEEEYMISIHYPDYAAHKKLHDTMREKVIPDLEQELEQSNYSAKSVAHFVEVCFNWLTNHIMNVDKAIARKRT